MPLTMTPAIVLPTAAPAVPSRGKGPRPVMNAMLHTTFSAVYRMPRRNGVRASPAARSAPPIMKNSSMPRLPTNMMRRTGRAAARTAGAAYTRPSNEVPQHAEHGHHERDEDDEDLNRDADRGVAGVPHEAAHQRVIHDPLQPTDEVLEGGGPRDQPDGAGDRPLDDGAVEGPGCTHRTTHLVPTPGVEAPRPRAGG